MNRRLYRSVHDRVLGGVAGGVADYFDLDPSLVRVAWAILILASVGGFLLLYIVMWIVVPEAPADYAPSGSTWGGSSWGGPPPVPPGSGAPPAGPDQAPGPGSTQAEAADSAAAPGSPSASPEPGAAGSPPSHGWYDRRYDRYRHRRSGGGGVVIGAVLILVGVWFLARDTFNWINLPELWPILIIGLGLLLLYGAIRPRTE